MRPAGIASLAIALATCDMIISPQEVKNPDINAFR
jgi:hypothetical protein